MSNQTTPIPRKPCGHACLSTLDPTLCCRCHSPSHGKRFLSLFAFCRICHGTIRKYVDGVYYQRCPACNRVVHTTFKDGTPVCAPLNNCGCKYKQQLTQVYKMLSQMTKTSEHDLRTHVARRIKKVNNQISEPAALRLIAREFSLGMTELAEIDILLKDL